MNLSHVRTKEKGQEMGLLPLNHLAAGLIYLYPCLVPLPIRFFNTRDRNTSKLSITSQALKTTVRTLFKMPHQATTNALRERQPQDSLEQTRVYLRGGLGNEYDEGICYSIEEEVIDEPEDFPSGAGFIENDSIEKLTIEDISNEDDVIDGIIGEVEEA